MEVWVASNSDGVGGEVMEEEERGDALPPPPPSPLLLLAIGEGVKVPFRDEVPPPPPPTADPVGEGSGLEGETETLKDCESIKDMEGHPEEEGL
jgi:hypothetical protein